MKIGIDARNLTTGTTGIGRYVLEMSRHLALRGHRLYLYLPQNPAVDLTDLPTTHMRISRAKGGIRRMLWAQTELPLLAKSDELDLFWGPAHRLPMRLSRRIPRVITIHDLVWKDMAETMRWQTWMADRWLMGPGVARADEVVADSTATANTLKEVFPGCGSKVTVVYPGLTRLGQSADNGGVARLGIDRPYILFVGTLEPRKNLLRLLQAYSLLPETIRGQCLLVLAGGQGWRLGDLREYVAHLKIESSVRLTGYVSDADLSTLYDNARFLAMPSLYEGFGFPLIEANSAGVPALTSNVSSMPEVAGQAALLVDPTSVQSIRDGLYRLATDNELHASFVKATRSNASRFSWDRSARELEDVFTKAIRKRHSTLHSNNTI